jgi:hypothetical protein
LFLFEKPRAPLGDSQSQRRGVASYHCKVNVGGKGKGAAHAAYISREGKYSGSKRYEDLEATAFGNMPLWAEHNTAHFWNAADEHERANGATYREIEVALPRELDPAQRRALVEDFVHKALGDRHAYQWAIHTPKASLEKGEQPHAHIMYSERKRDGIDRDPARYFKRYNSSDPRRGGCRKDSAGTEERLEATRKLWADVQNAHLEHHGHAARVDHRSLKVQGIDRQPEKHIGPSRVADMAATDVAALLERRAAEGELLRAQQMVGMIDLSGDLAAARIERSRHQKAASVPDPREQLARFRAGRLVEPAPAAPALSVNQLKAQDRAGMEAQLAKDYTVRPLNLDAPYLSFGRILLATDFHVAQHLGRDEATIHDRALLSGPIEIGESVKIQYRNGRGLVELRPLVQSKARGPRG